MDSDAARRITCLTQETERRAENRERGVAAAAPESTPCTNRAGADLRRGGVMTHRVRGGVEADRNLSSGWVGLV